MSNFNPYDASGNVIDPRALHADASVGLLSVPDVKKAEAIIKEANQFWLAILLTFLCSLLGILLIVPWYTVRLIQWNGLATKYPVLLLRNPPSYSLADRFQRSKWKLLTAIIVGAFIVIAIGSFLLLPVFMGGGRP